jgi:hypothetical protein
MDGVNHDISKYMGMLSKFNNIRDQVSLELKLNVE